MNGHTFNLWRAWPGRQMQEGLMMESDMFKSAADFFRAANGREVIKRVEGAQCAEDWPAMAADYRRQLEGQGAVEGKDFTIDDEGLTFGNRFIRRPKLKREARGLMNVRSADYSVTEAGGLPVYGDKKGATVEGGRLVKQYDGWRITFEIAA